MPGKQRLLSNIALNGICEKTESILSHKILIVKIKPPRKKVCLKCIDALQSSNKVMVSKPVPRAKRSNPNFEYPYFVHYAALLARQSL